MSGNQRNPEIQNWLVRIESAVDLRNEPFAAGKHHPNDLGIARLHRRPEIARAKSGKKKQEGKKEQKKGSELASVQVEKTQSVDFNFVSSNAMKNLPGTNCSLKAWEKKLVEFRG